jgi:glucose 1-dehydrogenase
MANQVDWLGLGGRVFVITGAAGGIGRAIASSAVAAGASAVLLDRDGAACEALAQTLRTEGGQALGIECDTSDEASIAAAAGQIQREFGRCDILVNNAGVLRPGPLDTLSPAEWNALLAVNVTGYLLCAQAFGRAMRDAGRGSMVHVASIAAHHPQPRSGAYSVSKAGVAMLSRQLALEWGPAGIRSNVVSPGLVRTPMSEPFYSEPGVTERRTALVPSRRIGTPQDIGDAVLYLASDRAAYVNGAEIVVDGGFDAVLMELVPRPGF